MEVVKITGDRSTIIGVLRLILPGRHFASNALGVFALFDSLVDRGIVAIPGYDPAGIIEILNRFPGIERRIERIGIYRDATIYDDYAHHPTEIRAVLRALRGRLHGPGRVIAVFQPHRYTRTRDLYEEFGRSFGDADCVYLLPLYSAGEEPIPGVDSSLIASVDSGRFTEIPNGGVADAFEGLREGDILVSLGAGDITSIVRNFLMRP
jgi:UDP-N-acetylmuramate--alanine ligase